MNFMRAENDESEVNTIDPDDLKARLSWLEAEVNKIKKRLTGVEDVYTDIAEMRKTVAKIWGAVKFGAPSVITAAVTAGYINGSFGTFLRAIFN